MKNIKKTILGLASAVVCMASFTSCLEETFPTTAATDEMIATSSTATAAMAMGMPAKFSDVWSTSSHCYFGYPAEMIFRDMLTGDAYHYGETGYSHFISWQRNQYMGDGYMKTQFHWNYHYGFLLAINGVIGAVNEEVANEVQKGYKGAAYAFRAQIYLDLARMYEFLPNDIFPDGKNSEGTTVAGLTVPIVTDATTDEEARNNPRAPHAEMAAFILEDLDNAERLIEGLPSTEGQTLPDLSVVYGLKARLYMWNEDYANAKDYARRAINATKIKPISQAKALSTTAGFNTATDFMWAGQQTSENESVSTGIINWTSWVSNQTTFGYTGGSTALYYVMDKKMYERISDTDWRKLMFKAPSGSALDGMNVYITAADAKGAPDYTALKFRPGNGDREDYSAGAAVAYPIMRVEEMYFIEAEAAAHLNAAEGKNLLIEFMQANRDKNYETVAVDQEDVIEEIIFQKRVEFWGEGQTFFDIKRLNYSVTRGYPGTNCQDQTSRLNTNGRPAWMNIVMVQTEKNNNVALENNNNPDPSDKYTPWTE